MRLINVNTFQLEEFFDDSIPEYAILSHTWGKEELSLQDYLTCHHHDSPFRQKAGFLKIIETCQIAKLEGLAYCWIDTICIDKTSSAELTEAINSMFRWYSNARYCLVHLEDYEWKAEGFIDISQCRWLTRGWCLQELIAPKNLCFYDANWRYFAIREELTLSNWTGIDQGILDHVVSLEEIPIAARMSWASQRRTSRIEDRAYCLLGILQVNMPMLYGEGTNAFRRLQEEALRVHDDPSIFLWSNPSTPYILGDIPPMLAPDVACFSLSRNIIFNQGGFGNSRCIFSHSSRGIHVKGAELKFSSGESWHYLLPLETLTERDSSLREFTREICLGLRKLGPGTYVRVEGWDTYSSSTTDDLAKPEDEFYIVERKQAALRLYQELQFTSAKLLFRVSHWNVSGLVVEPRSAWDSYNSRFIADRHRAFAAYARVQLRTETSQVPSLESFVIAFELNPERSKAEREWMVGKMADRQSRPLGLTAYLIPDNIWATFRSSERDWDAQRLVDLVYAHQTAASSLIPGSITRFETSSFEVRLDVSGSWENGTSLTVSVSLTPKS